MSGTRMNAFSDFEQIHDNAGMVWGKLGGGTPGQPRYHRPVIEPPTDLYETPDAVVVVIEVAGLLGQTVEIGIADGHLTVRGEKRDPHHHHRPTDRIYSRMEIPHGPFERTVELPAPVDGERAAVRYESGLLEITLPKRQSVAPRRIRVHVHTI